MPAQKFDHPGAPGALIFYLGDYIPYSWHRFVGGDSWNWDGYSSDILGLKKSKATSLANFEALLAKEIGQQYFAVCAVPSHDPATPTVSGVGLLAKRVAPRIGAHDGRDFLRRTTAINKLATGGDRSITIHLNSIVADAPERFAGQRILLLDDVLTTGNSIVACRKILLEAGAGEVICVALAKTKH